MDFEFLFEDYMNKIKHIDIYLRHSYTNDNDFTLFLDEEEFTLYNDVDSNDLLKNTRNTVINVISNNKKRVNKISLFFIFIVCYVINIKFHSDCYISKPYSFILDMLSRFDNISFIKNKKKALSSIIKIERDLIPFYKFNYDEDSS